MANAMYGKGRQHFANADISWGSDNIKFVFASTTYTPSINVDEFKSDIAGGAIVATSGNLASKTNVLGTVDAADVTVTAVSGSQISYVVIYKDTGTGSTSPLILLIDTATNLPVTPNGGDITVQWDNGSNKIFTLFEGLAEKEQTKFLDWLKGVVGIPAERDKSGIWIPTPQVLQTPRLVLA